MDKRLSLQLNGNRKVTGVLRGFDPFMNIVLDETVEEISATEKHNIGMVVRHPAGHHLLVSILTFFCCRSFVATASPSWKLLSVFRFCSINGVANTQYIFQLGSHTPHQTLTYTDTQTPKDSTWIRKHHLKITIKKNPRYLFFMSSSICPSWSPCSFYPLQLLPRPLVRIHWREYDPPCRHVSDRDTRKRRNHHEDKQDDAV